MTQSIHENFICKYCHLLCTFLCLNFCIKYVSKLHIMTQDCFIKFLIVKCFFFIFSFFSRYGRVNPYAICNVTTVGDILSMQGWGVTYSHLSISKCIIFYNDLINVWPFKVLKKKYILKASHISYISLYNEKCTWSYLTDRNPTML